MRTLISQTSPARLKRWAGYLTWSLADQFILLGLPKLVLFPILAITLGEGSFGSLVVSLGLIQLVGLAPSNGLVGFVIRDMVHEDDRNQELLLRTSFYLAGLLTVPFALAFLLGSSWISGLYRGDPYIKMLLPFLAGQLVLSNLTETALSAYRVERRFDLISIIHGIQTVVLFLSIPLYFAFGMIGVAAAHLLAPLVSLVVVAIWQRRMILRPPLFTRRFVRAAMRVWPAFSLSALIALSAGYLDRVLLGYWWTPAHVEPFFAAVTTASVITIPGTIVANLIFSILGRFRGTSGFDAHFYWLYACAVIGSSLAALAVGWIMGGMLLHFFYPKLATAAMELWLPVLAGFALLNVSILLRPFISKFLSPAAMPILSLASLIARGVPLLMLVPTGGPRGAAQALFAGGAVTAALWIGLYARRFLISRAPVVGAVSDADVTSTAAHES